MRFLWEEIRMARNTTGLKAVKPHCYILTTILISMLWLAPAVLAGPCENAAMHLRGGFEVTQGRGGLWGYMEKNASLKKESTLGFQIDGKLQRLVVGFETMCEDGKIPTQKTFDAISDRLDQARNINNQKPGRTPVEELLKLLNALNKNLDQTLSNLGM